MADLMRDRISSAIIQRNIVQCDSQRVAAHINLNTSVNAYWLWQNKLIQLNNQR